MKQKYTVNDWVELKWVDEKGQKYRGFINSEQDFPLNDYDTFLPFHTLEDFVGGIRPSRIGYNDIEVLPLDIREEDIHAMIDIALQAKDKVWFNELSKILNRSEEYVK